MTEGARRRPAFPGAEQWVPAATDLAGLRTAAEGCRGCDLYEGATHAVFGEGDLAHIRACTPWLDAELDTVDPEVVVLLGASAAAAMMGTGFRVTQQRGQVLEPADGRGWSGPVVVTIHPSAVLRADDRSEAFDGLVSDLRVAGGLLRGNGAPR